MILLAQLAVDSSYATDVLPGMLVAGAGLGLVIAPAMDVATLGVKSGDAGVASAMVNTMSQVGGSLGIALLSTVSASAASDYLAGTESRAEVVAFAAVEGYTTAFWWAAGIFLAGAIAAALLLRRPGDQLEPDVAADARPSIAF
jgi:hypothetical protein